MAAAPRNKLMVAFALVGFVAAVVHTGTNYQWRNGTWTPLTPLLIPIVAVVVPVGLAIAIKELSRKDGAKVAATVCTFFGILSLLIVLVPFFMQVKT